MILDIIGRGNVATHLYNAFRNINDVTVNMINPHTLAGLNPNADLILISVSDNAISEVAAKIPEGSAMIAHTSGSTSIDTLSDNKRYGVFYPLQTFSKGKVLNYSDLPFFIEGSDEATTKSLCDVAGLLSNKTFRADSNQRRALHVASTYACNFVNHLWSIADDLLQKNGFSFEVVRPLLQETLSKTAVMSPFDAQTGPAIRKDTKTIDSHLKLLSDSNVDKDIIDIYNLLTSSIIKTHS